MSWLNQSGNIAVMGTGLRFYTIIHLLLNERALQDWGAFLLAKCSWRYTLMGGLSADQGKSFAERQQSPMIRSVRGKDDQSIPALILFCL
jgi:hypothetical protein